MVKHRESYPSQCWSLCLAINYVNPSQRITEKNPLVLDKGSCFLDHTEMGFCTLRRRIIIHTGELFSLSTYLDDTMHQIPSI